MLLYIVSFKWRPAKVIIENENVFMANLSSILPDTLAEERIRQLKQITKERCPSQYIDFYIFLIAVTCIICSAMFTFIARSLNISMWFPLILLIIPTIISFWTSKRRKQMYGEIREFERQVKKALSEFTKHDCSYFIVWSFEKMQLDKAPCKHLQLCFMIRVIQLDPEMGLQCSSSSSSS
ncbi:hypothetical protein BCV71DRAFT_214503, partial [Rhizopus microsporus]